jgi:hypothetical protein
VDLDTAHCGINYKHLDSVLYRDFPEQEMFVHPLTLRDLFVALVMRSIGLRVGVPKASKRSGTLTIWSNGI